MSFFNILLQKHHDVTPCYNQNCTMAHPYGGPFPHPEDEMDLSSAVTCQGCGAIASHVMLDKPHNCWRNEDGTYEEGGTFQ